MAKHPLNVVVVGGGSIGGLIAHEITLAHGRTLDLKLMFKNNESANVYKRRGSQLVLDRIDNYGNKKRTTSAIQGLTAEQWSKGPIKKIDNLILATKCHKSFSALSPFANLLHKDSNVLFIQNGMGLMDLIEEQFWPSSINPRPNFYKAIITHGAYKASPSIINHVGLGDMTISCYPRNPLDPHSPDTPHMIDMILKTPNLNAKYIENYNEFKLRELEKLAVNCCINPLTAIFDCLNGDLLEGSRVLNIMKSILREFVMVIKKDNPELFETLPEASSYLNIDRLLGIVTEVATTTSKNSSSMREDMKSFGGTEIDFINGYICRLGRKHKIGTHTNNMLVWMVKSKSSIESAIDDKYTKLML